VKSLLPISLVFAFALVPLGVAQSRTVDSKPQRSNDATYSGLMKKAEKAREAGNIEEAVRLYKQVVSIKPGAVENWWYLGTLYYEADEYAEGRAAFRRVTSLKPEMSLGWAMLGLCEFETRDYDSALVHLRREEHR